MGGVIYGIVYWSQPVLVILASIYVGSGMRSGSAAFCAAYSATQKAIRRLRLAETSRWSAAKHCSARKSAKYWRDGAGAATAAGGAVEEESGTLTEIGGDPAFLAKLDPDAVEDASMVTWRVRPNLEGAIEAHRAALMIDLTYAAEQDPAARIRAPQAEGSEYEVDRRVRRSWRIRLRRRLRWC